MLSLAFSADAHLLASGSRDGCLLVWDVREASLVHNLVGHTEAVTCICFSPADRAVVASGSLDGSLRLWRQQHCFRVFLDHKLSLTRVVLLHGSDGCTGLTILSGGKSKLLVERSVNDKIAAMPDFESGGVQSYPFAASINTLDVLHDFQEETGSACILIGLGDGSLAKLSLKGRTLTTLCTPAAPPDSIWASAIVPRGTLACRACEADFFFLLSLTSQQVT
jgi:WD40 repeat protein